MAQAIKKGFSAMGGAGFPESPAEWVPAKEMVGRVHTVISVLKTRDTYKGVESDEALVLFRMGADAEHGPARAYSVTWQVVVKKLFQALDEDLLPLSGVIVHREKEDGSGYYDIVDPEDAKRFLPDAAELPAKIPF